MTQGLERQQVNLALRTGEASRRVRLAGYADRGDAERGREKEAHDKAVEWMIHSNGDGYAG